MTQRPVPSEQSSATERPVPSEQSSATEQPVPSEQSSATERPAPSEQSSATERPAPSEQSSAPTRQLLVVRSAQWWSSTGTLTRFERDAEGPWKNFGAAIEVNLGRHGMVWGHGSVLPLPSAPRKREGDGKSPAGAFALGTAFGELEALPKDAHGYPYFRALKTSYCVEEPTSPHYNELIDAREVSTSGWQRWSALDRPDGLFDLGIFVRQNAAPPKPGAGSCIFLHVERGRHQSTSGCTSMPKAALQEILTWLSADSLPLLVQLPQSEYQRLQGEWSLPHLDAVLELEPEHHRRSR